MQKYIQYHIFKVLEYFKLVSVIMINEQLMKMKNKMTSRLNVLDKAGKQEASESRLLSSFCFDSFFK